MSPIGRSCSQAERIDFFEFDKEAGIREKMVVALKEALEDLELKFSIGGQISIDIFPRGWDKRYALGFVEGKFKRILFFGDRTDPGGNDHEIYEDERTEGHKVKSPEDTLALLSKLFDI